MDDRLRLTEKLKGEARAWAADFTLPAHRFRNARRSAIPTTSRSWAWRALEAAYVGPCKWRNPPRSSPAVTFPNKDSFIACPVSGAE